MEKIDPQSVKMGSDAEVFLLDKTGRPFPVCGLVGGTKESPKKLTDDGVAVQEDNVMLEFNTAVAADRATWVRNLQYAQELAFAQVPEAFKISDKAVMRFDPRLLETEQAQQFGCEPDFNAWTMEQNPRPIPEDPTMRTAAAHVHISWDNPTDMEQRCRLIQLADIFVVLPSLTESEDTERRRLYGKAGSFRPKEYGVEHRVLDNYWIFNKDYLRRVWNRYQDAVHALNSDFDISPKLAEDVQEFINMYNKERGEAVYWELYHKLYPKQEKEDQWVKVKKDVYTTMYLGPRVARADQIVDDVVGDVR